MITARLNLSAIDKSKIFVGEKGKYIDIVLLDTPNGQYGDYLVVVSSTKAEREAGKKGAILGNGKIFKQQYTAPQQSDEGQFGTPGSSASDNLPF